MGIFATPIRQFPLRLEVTLADELDRISKETKIPKTTIARISIKKFIAELNKTGIRTALIDVCEA